MLKNKYGVKVTPVDKKNSPYYAFEMARNMRKEDIAECRATGCTPTATVSHSIQDSDEVYAARYKETLLCVFGVAGNSIWCLGTEAVKKHQKALVLIGYSFIKDAVNKYGKVYNCISKENTPAIRYIEGVARKGLELYEGELTINEVPFLYFELRRKDHV